MTTMITCLRVANFIEWYSVVGRYHESVMAAKQKACEVVARMPEGLTLEDIQCPLYVLECIERGERDIEDGKTLTHDEVDQSREVRP